jgi:hypothetical protein
MEGYRAETIADSERLPLKDYRALPEKDHR